MSQTRSQRAVQRKISLRGAWSVTLHMTGAREPQHSLRAAAVTARPAHPDLVSSYPDKQYKVCVCSNRTAASDCHAEV